MEFGSEVAFLGGVTGVEGGVGGGGIVGGGGFGVSGVQIVIVGPSGMVTS